MTYTEIFAFRAKSHDEAFARYPEACAEEVGTLLELIAPAGGERLLDAPSAGGFLSRYLPATGIHLSAVDPSPQLFEYCRARVLDSHLAPLSELPFADQTFDAVVCLAGLHHEQDQALILREFLRVLRHGGRMGIADVAAGSAEDRFLNGFVHENSSFGHVGQFLDETFPQLLAAAGFRVLTDRSPRYFWRFRDRSCLAECLRLMFGIDKAPQQRIVAAAERLLGIEILADGWVGMRWSLRQILAVRPA